MKPEQQREAIRLLARAKIYAPLRPGPQYPLDLGDEIEEFLGGIAEGAPETDVSVNLSGGDWQIVRAALNDVFVRERGQGMADVLKEIIDRIDDQLQVIIKVAS